MPVLTHISKLYTCDEAGGQADIHPIDNASVAWHGDTIQWVGAAESLPADFEDEPSIDAGGAMVVPGLIDCHTHLAFGGWRSDEFAARAAGAAYLEIARQGGGIAQTMRLTREATPEALVKKAAGILAEMASLGITTAECKSGYGLSFAEELKLLHVYKTLAGMQPVRIVPTLLAAHLVPPEYQSDRASYLSMIEEELLPAVATDKLARFCDVFVEETAFTRSEALQLLNAAKTYGLRPKLHVDQLSDSGGAALAAEVGAISADHLEYASKKGIEQMAEAGVVAVSLPFATFNLRQQAMPARAFIDAGVPVAVATDFNPGSAPSYHLPAAMYMACVMQHMQPAEVLKGATIYAAKALGMEGEIGSLKTGYKADMIVVDAPDVNHWLGHFRPNAVNMTLIAGQVV